MPVVTRRPDQIEANAVTSPMRRTFKARLKKAREFLARIRVHWRYQCATMKIEP
jgi:hypothetical protein